MTVSAPALRDALLIRCAELLSTLELFTFDAVGEEELQHAQAGWAQIKHEVTAAGDQRTLRAATPLLLVRKELQKTEKAADLPPLLLGENFFRLDDRYRFENGERRDATWYRYTRDDAECRA